VKPVRRIGSSTTRRRYLERGRGTMAPWTNAPGQNYGAQVRQRMTTGRCFRFHGDCLTGKAGRVRSSRCATLPRWSTSRAFQVAQAGRSKIRVEVWVFIRCGAAADLGRGRCPALPRAWNCGSLGQHECAPESAFPHVVSVSDDCSRGAIVWIWTDPFCDRPERLQLRGVAVPEFTLWRGIHAGGALPRGSGPRVRAADRAGPREWLCAGRQDQRAD
jgi:hypothetical protein